MKKVLFALLIAVSMGGGLSVFAKGKATTRQHVEFFGGSVGCAPYGGGCF